MFKPWAPWYESWSDKFSIMCSCSKKHETTVWLLVDHQVQYSAIKRLSRVEYFTTTVVNNLLYYLDTQPILT